MPTLCSACRTPTVVLAKSDQDGDPLNPCGDPPVGAAGVDQPPTSEGGARAWSLQLGATAVLGGAIL